jgi:hypothetical protein
MKPNAAMRADARGDAGGAPTTSLTTVDALTLVVRADPTDRTASNALIGAMMDAGESRRAAVRRVNRIVRAAEDALRSAEPRSPEVSRPDFAALHERATRLRAESADLLEVVNRLQAKIDARLHAAQHP